MDYYDLLEVQPGASTEVIRASFRALSQKWHPDRNRGGEAATVRMQALNEAYRILSDPASRAAYDQTLRNAGTERRQPASPATEHPRVKPNQPPQWLVVVGFTLSVLVASGGLKGAASSVSGFGFFLAGCALVAFAGKAGLKMVRTKQSAGSGEQAGDLAATLLLVAGWGWTIPHADWEALKALGGWPLLLPSAANWLAAQEACRRLLSTAADLSRLRLLAHTSALTTGWMVPAMMFAADSGQPQNWGTIPGFMGAVIGICVVAFAAYLVALAGSTGLRKLSGPWQAEPRAFSLLCMVLAGPALILCLVVYAVVIG